MAALIADMRTTAATAEADNDGRITAMAAVLAPAIDALETTTRTMIETFARDPESAAAGATPYCRLAGFVAAGWLMTQSALVAAARGEDGTFARAKIESARFFTTVHLPQAPALAAAAVNAAGPVQAFPEDAF